MNERGQPIVSYKLLPGDDAVISPSGKGHGSAIKLVCFLNGVAGML